MSQIKISRQHLAQWFMRFNEINSELFIETIFKHTNFEAQNGWLAVTRFHVWHHRLCSKQLCQSSSGNGISAFASVESHPKRRKTSSNGFLCFLSCLQDIQFILFKTFCLGCRWQTRKKFLVGLKSGKGRGREVEATAGMAKKNGRDILSVTHFPLLSPFRVRDF